MIDQEFKDTWELLLTVARTAQFVPIEDVQNLLATVNLGHAIGPIFYPTEYRDGMNNLDDQQTVAEGFLAFRKAIEEVKTRAIARGVRT